MKRCRFLSTFFCTASVDIRKRGLRSADGTPETEAIEAIKRANERSRQP